ncbi:O-antigen ligase family protein [Martelella alba]|uniref:O-antigen ligase family protein n=1 Tax=Martelella alba TaxID=2590451 RepID=UPI001E62886F|nr:O-antigen ligase family protein [Martelella alba]
MNALFTLIVLSLFVVDYVFSTAFVSYGSTHRLRAFYVEGGPYGLYLSTLFFLECLYCKRKVFCIIFLCALVLSQSKAGISSTALYLFYIMLLKNRFLRSFIKPKNFIRFVIFIFISFLLSGYIVYKVSQEYIEELDNISTSLNQRDDDPSLVMGRIAATYIGPNIIKDNPLIGIGLGAYSLVRNDSKYRGPFPVVQAWDLTGLGGFLNLLIENGIIGLLLFILCIFLYFKYDVNGITYILLFALPFLLGAQLYMVYPWFYLGLYSISRYSIDE